MRGTAEAGRGERQRGPVGCTLVSAPALVALGFGYLLGSIPFGYLLTRAAGLGDVRRIGSGNIGATNVLRTGHKGLAALTLLLDAAKGDGGRSPGTLIGAAPAAILAGLLAGSAPSSATSSRSGSASRAGRAWRPTSACCFGAFWPSGLVFCGLWLAVALLTRYSSLSALAASIVTPPIVAAGRAGARRSSAPSSRSF